MGSCVSPTVGFTLVESSGTWSLLSETSVIPLDPNNSAKVHPQFEAHSPAANGVIGRTQGQLRRLLAQTNPNANVRGLEDLEPVERAIRANGGVSQPFASIEEILPSSASDIPTEELTDDEIREIEGNG